MKFHINTDNFSPSDLCLFIESIETIARIEKLKHARRQHRHTQSLVNIFGYLDQEGPDWSSPAPLATDEEKEIAYSCHYAVTDVIYNKFYKNKQRTYNNDICVVHNKYCETTHDGTNSGAFNVPLYSVKSTKISNAPSSSDIYEDLSPLRSVSINTISSASYEEPEDIETTPLTTISRISYDEPTKIGQKKSFKKTLLGLICKKYRQHSSSDSDTSSWCRSDSWMKLSVVRQP